MNQVNEKREKLRRPSINLESDFGLNLVDSTEFVSGGPASTLELALKGLQLQLLLRKNSL